MSRHAKAQSTGSTTRQASRLGRIVRGAFTTRGASGDAKGTGASSANRSPRLGPASFSAVCLGAVAVALLLTAAPALAAGDANEVFCPPETESSPGFRAFLPDCRAYEMVSPPYKRGFEAVGFIFRSQDGSRAVLQSNGGSFAGDQGGRLFNWYGLSRVAGSGWQTEALSPPVGEFGIVEQWGATPDLTRTLWSAKSLPSGQKSWYVRQPGGHFDAVGPVYGSTETHSEPAGYKGASSELTHVLFSITARTSNELQNGRNLFWPGDTTLNGLNSIQSLYQYTGTGNSEPTLVGVTNSEQLRGATYVNEHANLVSECGIELGANADKYNAVSEDGGTVFFTAKHKCEFSTYLSTQIEVSTEPQYHGCVNTEDNPPYNQVTKSDRIRCIGNGPAVTELWARVDGERSVKISEPSTQDCEVCNTSSGLQEAVFAGASRDGSRVFFTTEQELLPGQTGMNLYEYDFNGPEASPAHPDGRISLVSRGSSTPEVQGVARVADFGSSDEGSRVYFVAKGKLTTTPNAEEKEPEEGADNLYVFGTGETGQPKFIAKLLTKAEAEKSAEEVVEEAAVNNFLAFWQARCNFESSCEAEAYEVLAEEFVAQGAAQTEDRSVWQRSDERPVQASQNGRFLVFPSSAPLTPDDKSGSAAPQLFEYDAQTEGLVRVARGACPASSTSCEASERYNGDGNVTAFASAPKEVKLPLYAQSDTWAEAASVLAVSDDGTVSFKSSDGLTPQALNKHVLREQHLLLFGFLPYTERQYANNVYEYRGGNVYLISDGRDATMNNITESNVELSGIDASGGDVYFSTADSLVPQDTDTQVDIYDAREGGGFAAPSLSTPCQGDACRGASGPQPAGQVPGSSAFQGPGNPPLKRHHRKHHRHHHKHHHARHANHNRRAGK